MTAKNSPVIIDAVWSAIRPPPINNTIATRPSATAQNIRWIVGGLVCPPEVIISMTNEAESEEVTKKRYNEKNSKYTSYKR